MKIALPSDAKDSFEKCKSHFGYFADVNDKFIKNQDFKTVLDGLSLAEDLHEEYLLQDMMTFTYAAQELRAGCEGDDVIWNRKRAASFRRMGFERAANVFQDYVDLVTRVSENTTNYPELLTDNLDSLQPELDDLHNRMVTEAKVITHEVIVPAALKSYDVELLPHKEAINYWVSLVIQSKIYQEKLAAAVSDKMFEGHFSPEQAKALEKEGVDWCFYLFEFQSDVEHGATRQLWQTNVGMLVTPFSPHRHSLLEVEIWPSGINFASIHHKQTKNESSAAALNAERVYIDEFIEAGKQLENVDTTGPLAGLHKIPIISSFSRVITTAFNPRSNFRFYRGLAQQGVKSGLIIGHLGRLIFWIALFFTIGATGIVRVAVETVIAGIGSWSDIAFVVGILFGIALLCQSVLTTLGLIIGSLDRRSGHISWNSNLPDTGHKNFITRNAKDI